MSSSTTYDRVREQVARIYGHMSASELDRITDQILHAAGVGESADPATGSFLPGSDEVVLITYGDTFRHPGQPHLQALAQLWQRHLRDVFSTVHVLPFFPSSSDGGFSVVDYRTVDPALGSWQELRRLAAGRKLMVDLVCNHGSAQSEWFAEFVANQAPGKDYYLTADPADDLSMVTRPRTHDLLAPVQTDAGLQHVWATFSHDQVDFNFANPEVLVEFCSILGDYIGHGATRVRLDAIAYLWKQIGTSCIHLPQTHAVVKLMRALVEARDPSILLITETNVPHGDNVSYFGDGDEAHVVYNFTLAPLIAWSLIVGQGTTLTDWLDALEPPPPGCAFLNFLASHDGIGLRPVEDLITAGELTPLVQAAVDVGGDFSAYSSPDGPRPYELNVSLADLLAGPAGQTAERFLLAHTLMLALQGIPAVYVHSMLVTPGDLDQVAATGHKRDINRPSMSLDEAQSVLASGWRAQTSAELARRISVRREHAGFGPEQPQQVLRIADDLVAVRRGSGSAAVVAVHNLASRGVTFRVPDSGLHRDLLSGDVVERSMELGPYQAAWLTQA